MEFLSHVFRFITAGNSNVLNNQADAIPTEIDIPYPTSGSRGDDTIVINAAIVVMLVKNIGTSNVSIVFDIAT